MEEWLCATVKTPPNASGGVSFYLFELGAGAVWEDLPDREGRIVLRASFPTDKAMSLMTILPRALKRAAKSFEIPLDSFDLTLELLPLEDYSEAFKKDLRPIRVSDRLWLIPSFWEGSLEGRTGPGAGVLKIDPGAAFGSGRHPTTFLCLKILSGLADEGFSPKRALDIGAGSGVLALAMAILFPQAEVAGVDNDPDTIAVAIANRALNGLPETVGFSGSPLSSLAPGYSLVTANLTLNPLLQMAPEITLLASPGCRLVISGLISEQAEEAAAAFKSRGWAWTRHLGQGEWSALSLELERPGETPAKERPERVAVPEPSLETALPHED